jgi:hypothetical protein
MAVTSITVLSKKVDRERPMVMIRVRFQGTPGNWTVERTFVSTAPTPNWFETTVYDWVHRANAILDLLPTITIGDYPLPPEP